jgi:DNA-binding response OmpR family regulator
MNTAHSEHHGPKSNRSAAPVARQSPRLLLAEDDLQMRQLVAEALRKDGYDVVEAVDGMHVLDQVSSWLLDQTPKGPVINLIISDIRMPGLSGLSLVAGLRQAGWTTPIILMTAFGDSETHAAAKRLGATAVFDKPFDVDDLRTLVCNLVPPS